MSRARGRAALSLLAIPLLLVAACGGGASRSTQAAQTEHAFWSDFLHYKSRAAYAILTPGVHQMISFKNFNQGELNLLKSTGGFGIAVKKTTVVGNCAQVKVTLDSAKGGPLTGYQNLVWLNGKWRISNENGQINTTYIPLKTCAY